MTLTSTRDAWIFEYVRTPRGKASASGGLHESTATDLVVHLMRTLTERGVDPRSVDDVILGCASQTGEQGANLARVATLLADWGDRAPGMMVNRFCASGIDAVATAAARIKAGDADLVVAGGVESASRVPIFSDRGPLWTDPAVVERVGSIHMGVAADLNAGMEGFTRTQLDEYGARSQRRAALAWDEGRFAAETIGVPRTGTGPMLVDELVRPNTTAESLAALPPAFAGLGADGQDALALRAFPELGTIEHLHTVGTSPAMADGAALLVIASWEAGVAAGLRPRARIAGATARAGHPVQMLTAGQEAVEALLTRAGLRADDVACFEFAEAFAALCLRFERDLGIHAEAGDDRMNPNGGTMAMGHAFGATGAIMIGGCAQEMQRRDARWGVAAVSGAAGLGSAVLLERPESAG